MHVPAARQALVEPLVVSWGWPADPPAAGSTRLVDLLEWSGTHDPAAYLAVPAALDFMTKHDWPAVQVRCRALVDEAQRSVCALTGQEPLYPIGSGLTRQMAALPLPPGTDPFALKERLYDRYRIEMPAIEWNGRPLLRISIQAYNGPADLDALLSALTDLL